MAGSTVTNGVRSSRCEANYDCVAPRRRAAILCLTTIKVLMCLVHFQRILSVSSAAHKDVSMRPIAELAAEICTLAGHINAAHHRFLILIAEFDRRNGWSDGGTQSCAHWLNWQCGIGLGAAREKVRVARALAALPKVSAAMASGKLSYSKAREITRVGDAHNEDYLLSIAEHGTAAHVENLVRAYRRCQEAEELSREKRQQQSRRSAFVMMTTAR